ncbi:hypothetical protein Z946_3492 [Sulfitobacter noctilucicola]|uniref:KDO2-lipid IV(A) lauroyltransferase n=1 Tax=Sulfitobacter noctilucicola TaxID=1342301 RepID=A0A7W6Q4I8_9RHOB|nr:hypothetical protein [Sulfitobacter noctilucicola]KIN64600.1 hypothetical protein Z946_3492 [Sulfitobacter noctilucicola]MBB4174249.1 KDO2-lipid IV(A) lauroyltransferase [Sulfitobacter noctilucicola]
MSFTTIKDRIWVFYDAGAAWLAQRPLSVRKLGYSVFGLVLWIAYIVPRSRVRVTMMALAAHVGVGSPIRLFRKYVQGFTRGLDRIEQVRHGRTDAIDAMLDIPQKQELDHLLQHGGVLMLVPHAHATLAMGRGLSRHYPYLALVRSTANKRRAASELDIYRNLGCAFLDIQSESPTTVARRVLKALKNGQLVVAIADRLRDAPPLHHPVDQVNDLVRARSFGADVGVPGWPARFAQKARVPIVPATITQTATSISLEIGSPVTPSTDLIGTTQDWLTELERIIKSAPHEWTFALDRHWSKALLGSGDKD